MNKTFIMLIKILKIKVEQNNQEFQLENWLSNYNYIHSTTAKLVKEKKDYYWHVLISFESKLDLYSNVSNYTKDYKAPIEFNEEIDNYLENCKSINSRIKNSVKFYQDELFQIKEIEDFKRIRGIGIKSFSENENFLKSILNIINKYKTLKISK